MYVSTKFVTLVEWAVSCGLLYYFYWKLKKLIINDNHELAKRIELVHANTLKIADFLNKK